MQVKRSFQKKITQSQLIKQVLHKIDTLSEDERIKIFKALAIDGENLVSRNLAYFQSLNNDPTLATYEFNYYTKRRLLLF